jgi:CSLREA domain-containing protein
MKRRSLPSRAAQCALAGLVLLGAAAQGAVFEPTTTADLDRGACAPGDCSLREAVRAANASAGADVILLDEEIYQLAIAGAGENDAATGDLDVEGELAILGEAAATTVVRGSADRVFHVQPGAQLELRNVTVTGGLVTGNGGGLLNEGKATLQAVTILSNGAVTGTGNGFGGGIFNGGDATLTLADSTLTGNSSTAGGAALAVHGTATVVNSTFAHNNDLGDGGGGIYFFSDAELTVNNATIARNHSNGSGGGIYAENTAFLGVPPLITNSILAGNTAGQHPDCSGSIETSYVLVGNATGCNGPTSTRGDQVGTAASPIDPLLATLADNGGETQTLLPGANSPAVNAGSPAAAGASFACAARDQRGVARPGAGRCDMGAVELVAECVPGGNVLCLRDGRFRVEVSFQTAATGALQKAGGVTLTSESGYFWFFDRDNVEVTVKVLDGCGLNNRFWVFAAGMTNVRVVLTVTDTVTGSTKTYNNPLGRTYRTILDTSALACGT